MSFYCTVCDRSFNSEDALGQHLRESRAHAPSFDCETCDRSFYSEDALAQHLRVSRAHAPSFDCEKCNRSFYSEDALAQHLRESRAHAPSFDCETCDRSFESEDALAQHLRNSGSHQRNIDTPLDTFFRSFPTFDYNPSFSPAISYINLQKHKGWRHGQMESTEAWKNYQDALGNELLLWYGAEDDLTAWHALCRAIGIGPLPLTCAGCQKAARRTHVNIIDLIEWGRGDRATGVQTFSSLEKLRAYTKKTGKIFRNPSGKDDSKDGGNVVLRHLLRKIF